MAGSWIDLLDPTLEELKAKAPSDLEPTALEQLLAAPQHEDEPRPTLQGHGDYVFGVFLVAVADRENEDVYYQEIDIVATHETLLTVRKTPANGLPPCDFSTVMKASKPDEPVGMLAYRLIDDIAERYLSLVDELEDEIDGLEDQVETQPADQTRAKIGAIRHDLLHIRRTLTPMRDAVRRVIDNTIDVDGGKEVFRHDVEVAFNAAYDKFLRASDGLDLARDLLAGVRDYSQAKIANDQNEVMKRLAGIATVFLPLTFLTGFFGQNFLYLTQNIEIAQWTFWVLGVGLEVVAAIGLFIWMKRRGWL
jgi:magnesium transporter